MKVSLIDYTGKGLPYRYAADLLVFTKNTRLKMSADGLEAIHKMTMDEIDGELEYMANTIPSSWEFINYTFMIEDCDRGFTHQLVRSRQGSYAQQTMRILNMSGFGYNTGPTILENDLCKMQYDECMKVINLVYDDLISKGAAIEDARGVLPTNIHTNIVAAFNLRSCAELISKRSSSRTQGAYKEFIEEMRMCILDVHPYFDVFLRNRKHEAAKALEEFILGRTASGKYQTDLIKAIDQLRK